MRHLLLALMLLLSACAGQQRITTELVMNGTPEQSYTHHMAKVSYGVQW